MDFTHFRLNLQGNVCACYMAGILIKAVFFLYCGENWRRPGRYTEAVQDLSDRVGGIDATKYTHATASRTF